jgi:hypothetical protein
MAYLLHPLVLTNVCDHLDRVRKDEQSGAASQLSLPGAPKCGLLFGVQTSQKVEIISSIEARMDLRVGSEDPASPQQMDGAQWSMDKSLIERWVAMGEL